jgi:hypothetical protein
VRVHVRESFFSFCTFNNNPYPNSIQAGCNTLYLS